MKARFLLSTLQEFPNLKDDQGHFLPEIAVVGRSNVGKSSLINHFTKQKKLAKVSSTPGKTQLLNFFLLNERFLLVDLPGYGFAKTSKEKVKVWSKAIEQYLSKRKTLKLVLSLIDARHEITPLDQQMLDWIEAKKIPFLLIFTKIDKLSNSQKLALSKKYPDAICYSIESSFARFLLEKKILELSKEAFWD